jgi:sugar phosphate isomerase/epimerase
MDRLGIEFISAMGMPPDDMVRMVAGLGLSNTSISPQPITGNPHGYPAWNLVEDRALLNATKQAARDLGVNIAQAEGFLIMPGAEISVSEPWLDAAAELGAPMINSVILEPDRSRGLEQFAALAEMAGRRGMDALIEFMPMMIDPGNLAQTLAFLEDSGAENGRVMLDAMHFYRSGSQTAELGAADLSRIGYVQLCDVPIPQPGGGSPEDTMQAYGDEARHNRLCPGEGDLPLAGFLAALPRGLPVGLEVPMLAKAQAGISPGDALKPCIEAARNLLSSLD